MKNILMGLTATACLALGPGGASAELFRASTYNAANSPTTDFLEDFAERIKTVTDGEIEFEIYPGGTLIPGEKSLVGLTSGVSQLANVNASQLPSDLPFDNVISDLGFIGSDQMALDFAATELRYTNPQIMAEYAKHNLIYGAGLTIGIWNIICADGVVNSLADLKGKSMRGTGGAQLGFIDYIGAVPVSVPSTEIYTGMQRGSLDCVAGSPEFLTVFWRLSELAKSDYLLSLGSLPTGGFFMNQDFWRERTPEQRRKILDSLSYASANLMVNYAGIIDHAFDTARAEDIALVEPTEEDLATLKTYSDDFVANLAQTSMEKRGIEDPTPLIEDMVALVDKWNTLLSEIDRTDVTAVKALLDREIYGKIDVETYGLN